jgi:hypothetical protein
VAFLYWYSVLIVSEWIHPAQLGISVHRFPIHPDLALFYADVCLHKGEVRNGGISEGMKWLSYAYENCCRISDTLQWLSALRQYRAG